LQHAPFHGEHAPVAMLDVDHGNVHVFPESVREESAMIGISASLASAIAAGMV